MLAVAAPADGSSLLQTIRQARREAQAWQRSTFAYLIRLAAGALTPASGSVTIGGRSVAHAAARDLAEAVTYVAQDSHVLDGTIAENLRLAAPAATDDELLKALETVALATFAAGFRDGLETPVGARGERLSGGQQRRLAVAQAVLRRPHVLLLDEPTEGTRTARRATRAVGSTGVAATRDDRGGAA